MEDNKGARRVVTASCVFVTDERETDRERENCRGRRERDAPNGTGLCVTVKYLSIYLVRAISGPLGLGV